jgi:predicted outer membrane repeat protein
LTREEALMTSKSALVCLAVALLTSDASGAIIRVPADAPTLQAGIDAAVNGDTVLVAPGTYKGPGNRDLSLADKNVALLSEAGATETIIDCEGASRAITVSGPALDSRTVVGGFTITRGLGDWYGGAIEILQACSPIVRDCVFELNHATGRGGAIDCNADAMPRLQSCVFRQNTAPHGGAMFSSGRCQSQVSDCEFTDNTAAQRGGAIHIQMVDGLGPDFTSCIFTGNSSECGGAVYIETFVSSDRPPEALNPRAPSQRQGPFDDCEFTDNTASAHGGAIYVDDSIGPGLYGFHASRFIGNEAEQGGAMFATGGELTVVWECLFVDNAASTGGAVVLTAGGWLEQCTFYGNTAAVGSALDLSRYSPVYGDGDVAACVIMGNVGGPAVNCGLGFVPCFWCVSYANPDGDELCPSEWGNLYTDPLLCGPENGDFTLCEDSPCLPDANPWGYQIGAFDVGCGPCANTVQQQSWGELKARFR